MKVLETLYDGTYNTMMVLTTLNDGTYNTLGWYLKHCIVVLKNCTMVPKTLYDVT